MSIGRLIHEYEESKREYQYTCQAIRAKAIELGLDEKVSEDVRASIAYLTGYKNAQSSRSSIETMKLALDAIDNKKYDIASVELDKFIRKNGGWK